MSIDFEHSFGFLVSDITRLMRVQFNDTAQTLGLTLAQSRALVHLARNEGINQKALAGLLEIQPITLLKQLDKLEEAGLIERRSDTRDRRMQRLYLTAAATPLLEKLTELGNRMTDDAFAGIKAGDRQQAIETLKLVKQNLHESCSGDSEDPS